MTDVSGRVRRGIQDLLERSADQLSELSIVVATTVNLLASKIRSRNRSVSSLNSLLSSLPVSYRGSFGIGSDPIEIMRGVASFAGQSRRWFT